MNKFLLYFQLFHNMGIKYFLFRIQYEIRRKGGMLKRAYPISWEDKEYLSLADWRKHAKPFFFSSRKSVKLTHTDSRVLSERVNRMKRGEYCFFSAVWYNLGTDYDWLTNPDTNYKYNANVHWTTVEDIVPEAGDIKYVWEKSRFSFLYDIIRYDQKSGENHASFVFSQIEDWIHKNPLNCGPNYKCSQEISLRVLNWLFALYYYKDSVELTEDVFRLIIQSVYWQIKHVRANINFSRIAVRNNHAITETLALYLVGLLFPQFPESGEWKKKGKKWFEEEIKYQVAEDGTYLQFSMNYHRVVVQLLTWAITLADRNGERFCDEVYKRAYQSVNFLYQCQDDLTGWLPNYGSNDGALFFKLNDCDYRDYRPQLDALYYLLTSEHLYDRQYEDREWYLCEWKANRQMYPPIKKQFGCISFDKGGYYCIREKDTFSFIRCGRHKDRPAHADNLHLDIWYQGENCLFDGGSYKYNTTEKLLRYFMGTESHNTIMLEGHDQMLKGDRFIWYNWSQAEWSSLKETEDTYIFEGKVSCFTYLNKEIKHSRKIVKWKNTCKWEIEDCIDGNPKNMNMRQLWHTNKDNLSLESNGETVDTEQLCSNYYGQTTKCRQIEFQTKNSSIKTILQFI